MTNFYKYWLGGNILTQTLTIWGNTIFTNTNFIGNTFTQTPIIGRNTMGIITNLGETTTTLMDSMTQLNIGTSMDRDNTSSQT